MQLFENENEIEICRRFRLSGQTPGPEKKVGIALLTLSLKPLNALRHQPEGETCGWYIWGGEELSQDPELFQPVNVSDLPRYCLQLLPYLALAPGFRVLLALGQRMFGMTHRSLMPRSTLPTFYVSRFVQL